MADINNQNLSLAQRLKAVKEAESAYEGLVNDPRFNQQVSPDIQKQLAAAIDDAKKTYEEKKTRNEWMEVAQILAKAGAQFAATRTGAAKSGAVDVSNLPFQKGIDYGGRTDQAFKEYQQQLRESGDLGQIQRQAFGDSTRERDLRFGKEQDLAKEKLRSAREGLSEAEREKRAEEAETKRAGRETSRLSKSEEKEAARLAEADRKLQIAELGKQEADAKKQAEKTQVVVQRLLKEDDLDSKTLKKYKAQYPDLAAQAGLDLEELDIKMQETDKEGRFFGKNEDPVARKALLKQEVKNRLNLLDGIRKRKQDLIDRKASSSQPATASAPEAPEAPASNNKMSQAQLTEYAKQYNMPEADARKHLESQGFTLE